MRASTQTLLIGIVVGIAAAAALPILVPVFTDIGRPLTKSVLKHGLLGLDRFQSRAARASESLLDLFAEVRAEVEAELIERTRGNGAPVASAPGPSSLEPAGEPLRRASAPS